MESLPEIFQWPYETVSRQTYWHESLGIQKLIINSSPSALYVACLGLGMSFCSVEPHSFKSPKLGSNKYGQLTSNSRLVRKASFNQIGKFGTTFMDLAQGFSAKLPFLGLGLSTFTSVYLWEYFGNRRWLIFSTWAAVQPAIFDSGVQGRSIGRHFGPFKNFKKRVNLWEIESLEGEALGTNQFIQLRFASSMVGTN